MITDGKVRGYIVAQFVYTIVSTTLRELAIPPNPFIVDEAFRTIFNDTSIDFDDLKAYDKDKLTTHIRDSVNQRMQAKLVHDIPGRGVQLLPGFRPSTKAEPGIPGSDALFHSNAGS